MYNIILMIQKPTCGVSIVFLLAQGHSGTTNTDLCYESSDEGQEETKLPTIKIIKTTQLVRKISR